MTTLCRQTDRVYDPLGRFAKHPAAYALLAEKQSTSGNAAGLVFPSSHATKKDESHLARAFALARKKANVPDFRFHDLRHTFATRLVQKGIDLYKVQRLLGHKTGLMTQRYAHHSPESLREGVRVLDVPQAEPVSTKLARVRFGEEQMNPNLLNKW